MVVIYKNLSAFNKDLSAFLQKFLDLFKKAEGSGSTLKK